MPFEFYFEKTTKWEIVKSVMREMLRKGRVRLKAMKEKEAGAWRNTIQPKSRTR